MRTTLRLVLPLIVSVAVVSLLFASYQVRTQRKLLRNDLTRRAEILGDSLQESVEQLLDKGNDKGLQRLVDRFGQLLSFGAHGGSSVSLAAPFAARFGRLIYESCLGV